MGILKELRTLMQPYYWLNILMSVSYVVAKKLKPLCLHLFYDCQMHYRELEWFIVWIIIVMVYSRKAGNFTLTSCLSGGFKYIQLANTIFWSCTDYGYGLTYMSVCVMAHSLLTVPLVNTAGYITYFRSIEEFEEELAGDKRISWLICFYTPNNMRCAHFDPIFAQLSAEYSLDNLKFAKIDVGIVPEAAKKYRLTSSSLQQFPTVILFQQGEEIMRRPSFDFKGKVLNYYFTAVNVCGSFCLKDLYKDCMENPLEEDEETAEPFANEANGNQ